MSATKKIPVGMIEIPIEEVREDFLARNREAQLEAEDPDKELLVLRTDDDEDEVSSGVKFGKDTDEDPSGKIFDEDEEIHQLEF